MYLSGQGVEQDSEKAASWFAKAAAQGNARAQYNLALLILRDDDALRNSSIAETWLRRAARAGHVPAMHRLASFYELGEAATGRADVLRISETVALRPG
jgi:uncharacterized protein